MTVEENKARYRAAAHAMQSGVEFNPDKSAQQPKHLRVGINVALRDFASLASLLIRKGLITEEELHAALADGMEQEAADHQRLVSEAYGGASVKLA